MAKRFMTKIDYLKMLEQDEKLREFTKECIFNIFLKDKNSQAMIMSILNFYNMDVSPQEVVKFFDNMKKMGES